MAKNKVSGDARRLGDVRVRSQIRNPITGTWTKRDDKSGKFVKLEVNPKSFRGVRKQYTENE
jgi:hypothetical protein